MLTLFIADDEYFILERLKQLLDYPRFGFQLIGTAQNGSDALLFIRENKPDLAILDIRMPEQTGLDIAKKIYENNWNTKVIILTSYDYFDYAKQAIHYQVFSYLLKPVNAKELEKTLLETADQLYVLKERDKKLIEYEQIQTELKLQRLMSTTLSNTEREKLSAQLPGIRAVHSICCIKLANTGKMEFSTHAIRKALCNSPGFPQHYYIEYQDNITCFFLKKQELSTSLLTEIQHHLSETFHTSANVVVAGHIKHDLQLPLIYMQSLEALQNTIFLGENTIMTDISEQTIYDTIPSLTFNLCNRLSEALRQKDTGLLVTLIHDAFLKLKQAPNLSNLETLLLQILSAGKSVSSSGGISYTARKLIDNHNSLDTIEEWCCTYLSGLTQNSNADISDLNIAKSVMEIIQISYKDTNLDLPKIAAQIGYSPNYISNIFKRNTGLTVIQYITQCRMNAAYLLLSTHHLPINRVYEKVGYSNPFYFSKRFKQYFGYSPSECSIDDYI